MNKLIVVVMGQNAEKFLPMCLESVKSADSIVYCDGGSKDVVREIISDAQEKSVGNTIDWIENPYDQEDKAMNGKQRNFYLNYIKQEFPDDWALCLDADEVVDDGGIDKLKEVIKVARPGLYNVHMRHFIGDLGHEDATTKRHYCLNRFFKISEADSYPLVEHPVLQSNSHHGVINETTVWHLAYCPNMWDIKKRYDNHLKKSNMHTPEFLKIWYHDHLFGTYPKSEIKLTDIPKTILDEFSIDKDELYFKDRKIELKHAVMVKQWNDYFKPKSVLDLGCGRGSYMYFWNWFTECSGIEISSYARDNSFIDKAFIRLGDVADENCYMENDLITAVDILEHLDDDKLDKTLKNMVKYGKKFLFSIPFIGDPNLLADKTHTQFKTKEEWVKLIESYGIRIIPTPQHFLFKEQILVGGK